MVEVRDTGKDLRQLRLRLAVAMVFVISCFGVLVARFVYLQVYRYADFHAQAEENRIALVPAPPSRGLIFDRNGVLLAENVSAYTLELLPKRVAGLEPTIEALSRIVEITPRDRRRFRRLLEDSRSADSVPLKVRLSDEEVARLAVQRFRFPGVEIRARLFRNYPLGETAAHVLGHIGRISPEDKRRLEEEERLSNYAGSTHIGKIGIELSYETALHGRAGADEVEVSAGGRVVRTLSRTPPVPGSNLVLSIDVRLQKLAEELFGERRGALVAIEPGTGDVLAFVSKPSFDPNLFIDGIDPQAWQALNEDPDKPLLNRPLRGTYPPGSTYKPFMALAALESGTRTPQETISDPGYFQLGNHRFRDSKPGGHGTVDLRKSIVVSSDTYYYKVAFDMGVDRIHDFMKPWGFGQLTGIDLEHEATGILPSSAWKLKRYKQKWLPGETPSIGIGQGYNAFTILQLAHATATLANDGIVMKPHLVQTIEDPLSHARRRTVPTESYRIPLRRDHLDLVRHAMADVNRFGTSRVAFANTEYVAAGKTGTAQVIGIKQGERYDARRVSERHRDHSLFMAFAPLDEPKIAVAVIVENGGFGAQAAAPIARKLFDFYLLGKLPKDVREDLLPRLLDEAELRDIPEDIVEPDPAAATEPARP
ncbi:MAG: penicillin-binding protein 2 [Burkholderiales bacterium]|nr:penicillin-binding protein 2 [Burkholderiales bacterium]OJX08942.1 MAG: penicillin-binding protein 2 [Burkholderiales bacterium 70-64]